MHVRHIVRLASNGIRILPDNLTGTKYKREDTQTAYVDTDTRRINVDLTNILSFCKKRKSADNVNVDFHLLYNRVLAITGFDFIYTCTLPSAGPG